MAHEQFASVVLDNFNPAAKLIHFLQSYGPEAVAVAANSLEAAVKKSALEAIEKAGYSIPLGASLSRAAAGMCTFYRCTHTTLLNATRHVWLAC